MAPSATQRECGRTSQRRREGWHKTGWNGMQGGDGGGGERGEGEMEREREWEMEMEMRPVCR